MLGAAVFTFILLPCISQLGFHVEHNSVQAGGFGAPLTQS
jgi:hypothetical protein